MNYDRDFVVIISTILVCFAAQLIVGSIWINRVMDTINQKMPETIAITPEFYFEDECGCFQEEQAPKESAQAYLHL